MKRNKKEEELKAIRIRMALKETVAQVQPTLLKLTNPESMKEEDLKKLAIRVKSIVIDSKQYIQGYGLGRTWYNTANIRLAGNWLMDRGFHPRGKIKVLALEGLLVICPE